MGERMTQLERIQLRRAEEQANRVTHEDIAASRVGRAPSLAHLTPDERRARLNAQKLAHKRRKAGRV
jgi:hypothetical protein